MRSRWWAPALALLLAGCFQNAVLDEGKVREATQDHFGSALAPIEIGPVVVSGDHAVADWTQADFGGRALYQRDGSGWMLLLCSGDSIRRAANLERAGVPAFNAGRIAEQLATAEAGMPAERRARLRRFVGTAADHEDYLKSLGGNPQAKTITPLSPPAAAGPPPVRTDPRPPSPAG